MAASVRETELMFKYIIAEFFVYLWETALARLPLRRKAMLNVAGKVADARRSAKIDWEKETR